MCGIVGYVGTRDARGVVVDALRRMEYRGYDSSGVALLDGVGGLTVRRRAGRLANLEAALAEADAASLAGSTGLGHTRWATHGRPTDTLTRTATSRARSRWSTTGLSRTMPSCALN